MLDQLAAHPRRFGRTYPFNLAVAVNVTPTGQGQNLTGGHFTETEKVQSNNRIQEVQLQVDGTGLANLTIYPAGTGIGEPCYWLPWQGDRIFKTKLADGGMGQPRFFFTAGLSGCSVFIETHNGRTHVYHANAGSAGQYHGVTPLNRHYHPSFTGVRDYKASVMRSDFGELRKDQGGDFLEVNGSHYLESPLFKGPQQFQRGLRRLAYRNAHVGRTLLKKSNYVRNFHFNEVTGYVFGVWKHGEWRFYRQTVVEYSYQRRTSVFQAWNDHNNAIEVFECERVT